MPNKGSVDTHYSINGGASDRRKSIRLGAFSNDRSLHNSKLGTIELRVMSAHANPHEPLRHIKAELEDAVGACFWGGVLAL